MIRFTALPFYYGARNFVPTATADDFTLDKHISTMKTPESVLKKQATQAKIAEAKAAAEKAAAAKAKEDIEKFKANAAKYDAEYEKAQKEAIENRRKAKAEGGFYVPAEPKLALVIRIRGTIGVSPKAKKVMQVSSRRRASSWATEEDPGIHLLCRVLLINPHTFRFLYTSSSACVSYTTLPLSDSTRLPFECFV